MITSLYAALLGLLFITISFRVSLLRLRYKQGIGHGEHHDLARAVRVQANFAEYVPFALLLLFIAEWHGAPFWLLHLAGSLLFLARVLHAAGLSAYAGTSFGRFTGILLTWSVIAFLSTILLINFLL